MTGPRIDRLRHVLAAAVVLLVAFGVGLTVAVWSAGVP